MSISSFTMVTMLDTRPAPITISMPRTNDIPNRVITFKDIYGAAANSSITLVTQGGDVFENSTFSTILSNAYDTITFHAGLPGRWHRTAGTNVVGSITNASTFTNSISTNVAYAKTFYGDGSQLTGVLTTGTTTTFSNITVITSISNAGWLSNTGGATFGSGLTVASGVTSLGSVSATSISNSGLLSNGILCNAGLLCNNGVLSNLTGGAFFASISNGGAFSNLGGTGFFGALTTTSHSNTGLFSNGVLCNAGLLCNNGVFSNLTGGAFFASLSNAGALSNTGGTTYLASTGVGTISLAYPLDVYGIARSAIPISSISNSNATFGNNSYGIYYYITNSGFSNIIFTSVTPTPAAGWYILLRNNTGSYLSITPTGASAGLLASAFTIPPSNSVTVAYDAPLTTWVAF